MGRDITILLTGTAGYIGSHTYLALHAADFTPVILDDFSNSSPLVLERLQRLPTPMATASWCVKTCWPLCA